VPFFTHLILSPCLPLTGINPSGTIAPTSHYRQVGTKLSSQGHFIMEATEPLHKRGASMVESQSGKRERYRVGVVSKGSCLMILRSLCLPCTQALRLYLLFIPLCLVHQQHPSTPLVIYTLPSPVTWISPCVWGPPPGLSSICLLCQVVCPWVSHSSHSLSSSPLLCHPVSLGGNKHLLELWMWRCMCKITFLCITAPYMLWAASMQTYSLQGKD
jgi:hypothetical protein